MKNNADNHMAQICIKPFNDFFSRWIKGFLNIDAFAMLLILPNKQVMYLSTQNKLAMIYRSQQLAYYDQPMDAYFYENFEFYPWRMSRYAAHAIQNKIHNMRENQFDMHCGTNFVRQAKTDQGPFYLIYSVSSHKKNPLGYTCFASNVQLITQMGDFCYHTMRPNWQMFCDDYSLPMTLNESLLSELSLQKIMKNYINIPGLANHLFDFINKKSYSETEEKMKDQFKVIVNPNKIQTKKYIKKQRKTFQLI